MNWTKRRLVLAKHVGAIVIAALMGVSGSASGAAVDPRIVKADNEFAFKLLGEVMKTDSGKNVFISPTSIALALHMTYDGARGKTQEAMAKTLGLQGIPLAQVNRGNAGLTASLSKPGPKVDLAIANSIWTGDRLKPGFTADMKRYYDAGFGPLDVKAINSWVSLKTKGKITELIKQLNRDEFLILVNAVYFKGIWTREFDKAKTKDAPFRLPSGKTKTVKMMHQTGEHEYFRGDGFQALRLPYGDGRMAMYVFLPDGSTGLNAFRQKLSAQSWQSWMGRFEKTKIDIAVPRFKLEYGARELKDALVNLGMGPAFRGRADFSGMVYGAAMITRVLHKTFVEVNEQGTEAAGATAVIMGRGLPAAMVVDHPFFLAIRDDRTGLMLFMGQIVDPKPG